MEKYRMNYETFEISRSTWVPETLMEQQHGQLFTTNLMLPLWNINVNDAAHTSHNTNYLRNSFVKIMYGEFGRTGLNGDWSAAIVIFSLILTLSDEHKSIRCANRSC